MEIFLEPIDRQVESCLWNLKRCVSSDWTLSLIFNVEKSNRSLNLFSQQFESSALLEIQLIVINNSYSNLRFDFFPSSSSEFLRIETDRFSFGKDLFVQLVLRNSESLSLFLFGQLIETSRTSFPSTRKLTNSLSLKLFHRFQSIRWNYDPSFSGEFESLFALFLSAFFYRKQKEKMI